MSSMEKEKWVGLDQVREIWESDYQHRRIVSNFLQDKVLGKKRLVSMPDRLTNTVQCVRYSWHALRYAVHTILHCCALRPRGSQHWLTVTS